MRRPSIAPVVCVALAVALACVAACAGGLYESTGVKAIDGDSVKVRMPSGLEVEVRLLSIDCPEHGQRFADEAKAFSEEWIAGRSVRLRTGEEERDRYNRLLAIVESDEGDLNTALVKAGLAAVYIIPPNKMEVDRLLEAQRIAHESKLGIWSSAGKLLEPRDYRHRNDATAAPRQLDYRNHLIVGNSRSQVAHWPGCRHASEMSEENVVYFESVAAADAAGYRMERGRR